MEIDFFSIDQAFSKQSVLYDQEDEANAILQWMRKQVRTHVERFLKKDDRLLELNAGTGLDAFYFSRKGHQVHTTDLSEGMIRKIAEKITENNIGDLLSCQQCSYTELSRVKEPAFDYVFSNFGGLNCIPDLQQVTKDLPSLLLPGAYVTFVIMPPVCPWEFSFLLKGNFKRAFRRLGKNGATAHLEGKHFRTYYFTPTEVVKAFGKEFRKVSLQGLASVSPPPHHSRFQKKFPGIYTMLAKADQRLSYSFPFNCWADHFILTMQYQPSTSTNTGK